MEAIFYPHVIRHKLGLNIPDIWSFLQLFVTLLRQISKSTTPDDSRSEESIMITI